MALRKFSLFIFYKFFPHKNSHYNYDHGSFCSCSISLWMLIAIPFNEKTAYFLSQTLIDGSACIIMQN